MVTYQLQMMGKPQLNHLYPAFHRCLLWENVGLTKLSQKRSHLNAGRTSEDIQLCFLVFSPFSANMVNRQWSIIILICNLWVAMHGAFLVNFQYSVKGFYPTSGLRCMYDAFLINFQHQIKRFYPTLGLWCMYSAVLVNFQHPVKGRIHFGFMS